MRRGEVSVGDEGPPVPAKDADLLVAAWADWRDEPSAVGELLDERRGEPPVWLRR